MYNRILHLNMAELKNQKKLAADILKCGVKRIWCDPEEGEELAKAKSRAALRSLIKDGYILKKPVTVHTHFRATRRAIEKRQGRHKGPGKRFGTHKARNPEKKSWIRKIRSQRELLKVMRREGRIDRELFRILYRQAKGNFFKSKAALNKHVNAILKEKEAIEAEKKH